MARYNCERCKAQLHTTDPTHICKDLAARIKRQESQLIAVRRILYDEEVRTLLHGGRPIADIAEDIVRELNRLGVSVDA